MFSRFLLLLLLMLPASPLPAQTIDSAAPARALPRYDSSAIEPRLPSAAAIEALRSDEDLVYDRPVQNAETIWQRIWEWISDLLGDALLGNTWLLYTVAGLVVAFALWKIFSSGFSGPFKGAGEFEGGRTRIEENIHEIDFDPLLEEAVRAGDYRRATRLLYLKGLRRLSERGLIEWRRDKTNHDYLRELNGTDLADPFARGTILFEYVWYGDFPIDRESYGPIAERLRAFIERVEARR
jgi:hypothetical protein